MKTILKLIFIFFVSVTYADNTTNHWFTITNDDKVILNIDLFLSSTCPHCEKADLFFRNLEKKDSGIVVHRYYINKDEQALDAFYNQLKKQHSISFSVPAIFFCDARWSGFESKETTGQALLKSLDYCRQKISQTHELNPATVTLLRQWGTASQFRLNPKIINSAEMVIPLTALAEALIPCSLFCFIAFLGFMWLYSENKWQQFTVGVLFIIALGIAHYVQQVHFNEYYQHLFKIRIAAVVVGLLLLIGVWRNYSLRRSFKPLTYGLIILTPMVLVTFQQFCKLNISLIFEQWLTDQNFSASQQVTYQLYYQALYLLPWLFMVILFLLFSQNKRTIAYQRLFKVTADCIFLCIGVLLLVAPHLLASLAISVIVLFVSFAVGVYCHFFRHQVVL